MKIAISGCVEEMEDVRREMFRVARLMHLLKESLLGGSLVKSMSGHVAPANQSSVPDTRPMKHTFERKGSPSPARENQSNTNRKSFG